MFHLLFVCHHELVVFLQVLITALTHLTLFLGHPGLFAITLVHLGLQDTELIQLGLSCIAQTTVARGPVLQAKPEVREFLDDLRIVTDGRPEITGLFQQQGPVEQRHQVVGLQLQHEVEVFDTSVVIAHLGSQQTTVIVSQEVVGIQVEGRVIIGHGPAQVVLVIPR